MRTLKELDKITGGLSNTSKMPCYSWGIPAATCITGSKLAKEEGTICFDCYALKGAYKWSNVHKAYSRRLKAYNRNKIEWREAMVETIAKKKSDYFRFFDSGDLQSVEVLEDLVWIASRLPNVKFWLPTKEATILTKYAKRWGTNWPENLTIRLSSFRVNGQPLNSISKMLNVQTSTVRTDYATCLAPIQDGKCDECRACWNKTESNVSYLKH